MRLLMPIRAGLLRLAFLLLGVAALATFALEARAQRPLEITVAGGRFEPVPIAVHPFETASGAFPSIAGDLQSVMQEDLANSGLFRIIPKEAHLAGAQPFDRAPSFPDWQAINAQALVMGHIGRASDGRLLVEFLLYDVLTGQQLEGQRFFADPGDWRRVAHKVADAVYAKLTGEGPYFDSSIVFVDETGPKGQRQKRLAVMDQDGANLRYLPASGLVLTPRVSPVDRTILYISYDRGQPEVFLLNLDTGQRERLGNFPGMSFAPRFSPNGQEVVLSLSEGGNTDLYAMRLSDRSLRRLTTSPAIDTSASYSPDGSQIVFESDRGGRQQLYVMSAGGGEARRISFGAGSYATPVWSPRGDMVAFTKILQGRFHIGVMRIDGSDERLLTTSFLDEGPTFSPNGRVVAFYRETPGANGRAMLMSVDISGRNLRRLQTANGASDPAWTPLRK